MGSLVTVGRDSLLNVDLTNTDVRKVIPEAAVENAKRVAVAAAGLLLYGANSVREQLSDQHSSLQHFMNRCD